MNSDNVQTERLAQSLVYLAEHLVGLDHLDPMTIPAEYGFAQAVNRTGPHSGLEARTEINTQPVGFPVVEGRGEPFARGDGSCGQLWAVESRRWWLMWA